MLSELQLSSVKNRHFAGILGGIAEAAAETLLSGNEVLHEITDPPRHHQMDLSTALQGALKTLKRKRQEQWLQKGENEIPKWVVCNRKGNPADMPNFKARHFCKCLEKAGLRKIHFHDLRHTFATLLLQNGEPIAYVPKELGHSSIKLTVDTYCHWMPGKNCKAMDRLPVLGGMK